MLNEEIKSLPIKIKALEKNAEAPEYQFSTQTYFREPNFTGVKQLEELQKHPKLPTIYMTMSSPKITQHAERRAENIVQQL